LAEEQGMTAYVPPRRVTSTATTVTVQSASTALSAAAGSAPTGQFTAFSGGGLSDQSTHPITGVLVDVTCDGHSAIGSFHTILDWAGKGCYDPTTKRVLFMATGTGSTGTAPNNWQINTLAIYREGPTSEGWTATRSFRPPDQGTDFFNIGHQYDNNCISLATRRAFKKQFHNTVALNISAPFHVFNLDTNAFEASLAAPSGDTADWAIGPADVATTLGTSGRLWYLGIPNGSNDPRLSSYDLATGNKLASDWTTIKASGSFPAIAYTGSGANWSMSFNPRAFSGVGAALILGVSTTGYMVKADAPTYTVTTLPALPQMSTIQPHLCKEPGLPGSAATGWLYFSENGNVYRYRPGDVAWSAVGTLPSNLASMSFISIPIDEYGVVWLIGERGVASFPTRAWLYKP
jgi:hypothetical protein